MDDRHDPKYRKLTEKVRYILERSPQARNSDVELTMQIWRYFYPEKIIKTSDGKNAVLLQDLFELPREDHVKRYRAKIQNEEFLFLPTVEKIAIQRKINADIWRKSMRGDMQDIDPIINYEF